MTMKILRGSIWEAFVLWTLVLNVSLGDIRYSIPEEMKEDSVVGKIMQDLGVNKNTFSSRNPRIEFEGGKRYCKINPWTGDLVVYQRIDREELCGQKTSCTLAFDFFMENPLELHRVTIEILDVNDNAPTFPHSKVHLEIRESEPKGARFLIDEALDPDSGLNSLQGYRLTESTHFSLAVHANAETGKYAELLLENELDREKLDKHTFTITAYDGGSPQKSGTVLIDIRVLDANDNRPVFSKSVYKVTVSENIPLKSSVVTVTAADPDEGSNGEITYEFSHISVKAKDIFSINQKTGEITVKGPIDFEDTPSFEIRVKAKDGAGQAATCKVTVDVMDMNDNAPVIMVKSLKSPVPEDSPVGTEVALIYVHDKDTESNSNLNCFVAQNSPFKLTPSIKNHFAVITTSILDREKVSEYNITIGATDGGSPPLNSSKIVTLLVADVNDNHPTFGKQSYSAYVAENNKPGTSICSVTARDPDWRQNGTVLYSLQSNTEGHNVVQVSSYLSINADTGVIHAVRAFDYEYFKKIKVLVVARDNGSPPLSNNVTVSVFITDENDNSPQILYPAPEGTTSITEIAPKTALSGSLISKVIAVDADSGQNAWLSYQIVKSSDPGLFIIGLHTGEIRTQRDISESDSMKQNLVILVKDNGQSPLSATCSIYLLISDNLAEVLELKETDYENNSKLTVYLIVALISVSTIFLTFIIVTTTVQFCQRRKPRLLFDGAVAIPSTYLPPNYAEVDVTGSSYNYDSYLTTGSHTSDFKFVSSYNTNTFPTSGTVRKNSEDFDILSLSDAGESHEV